MKKILAIILTLSIFLAAIPLSAVNVFAASTSDLTFSLNSDGASCSVSHCNRYANGSLSIPSTYNGKPVTSIGWDAFEFCTSLTSVTIPDSVTSIGECAFSSCESLTSVTIPDSVTSIGECAFYSCYSLTSITIPDSVTSIGSCAFLGCSSLASIKVSEYNQNYSSKDGVLFNKDKTELVCYPAGKTNENYTIPDSVTSIGRSAFSFCDSLTSVTIPDSVTSIGESAFLGCYSLKSVTIPDSVTSIGDYAFLGCYSFKSVTIPDSVTSIGYMAFNNCTSLSSVYYRGSENDRNNITIGSDNSKLTNATWYYNSCIGRSEHTYNSDCDAFCNVCAYKREVIHTLGDDGLCTKCGKPPYTVGDLNGDYAVNTTDLAVMKLFLAGISQLDGTGLLAGDLNEDGKVDTTDLAALKLFLAGV